ncbi:hypothetical protein [Aquimarina macrocephali]|uniref:hypothetical protein n=1 Tax=Aquimarina macrocephali TaxID=666563 RepID=UPI003F669BAE
MARNEKSRKKNNAARPNFWGMLQNVLIASLHKGQLLPMTGTLGVIIFMIRLPSDQLLIFLDKMLNYSLFNCILGWIIAIIVTFGSIYITKRQRRIHTTEIKRLAEEKKALQQIISNKKLPSSNKKK